MKIVKELKHATFEWEEEEKTFKVTDSNNNSIELNKIYGFALMRFILRIAQKNFLKNPLAKRLVEAELDGAQEDNGVYQENFIFNEGEQ